MPRMTVKESKVVRESTVYVKRTIDESGNRVLDDEELETIAVHEFITQPAEVGISLGLTISLGGYNMARLDVIIKRPCYDEEVEQKYATVVKFAESKIKDEVRKIKAFTNGSKDPGAGPL